MSRVLCIAALLLCVGPVNGAVISYDCDVAPDDSSLQNVFSTQISTQASWTSNNSELTITTALGQDFAWFGNHLTQDPVPWDLADNSDGNIVTMKTKWTTGSENWDSFMSDDAYYARIYMSNDTTVLLATAGGFETITLDATTYHTYSMHLADGSVTYTIDNTNYTYTPGTYTLGKHLLIGDTSAAAGSGSGSMIIDYVNIETIPEPSTFIIWSVLGLVGVGVWQRKRRAA